MTTDNDIRDAVFTSCGRLYELIENIEDEELSDEIASHIDTIEGAVGAPDRVIDE